jgi:phenylpropionate dioxygenase-like ring-hydroxylating dioxygenase large terminal subunit
MKIIIKSLLALVPGLFYPIAPKTLSPPEGPVIGTLYGEKYVIYKGAGGQLVAHTDVCPHLGASLATGHLDKDKRIVCPYHGFTFSNSGKFCGILDTGSKRGGKKVLDPLPVFTDDLCTYIVPEGQALFDPFQPPEAYDKTFRVISGFRDIPARQPIVTENILDNLHLGTVHLFGNSNIPLPRSIKFEKLSKWSGRTAFEYSPRPGTLSTILAGSPTTTTNVHVENEYHLPSTTITRVRVGPYTKTVLTRAQAMEDDKTRLYYAVYRNFWGHALGDSIMNIMMQITLDEDVAILSKVHPASKLPNDTLKLVYDVTFMEYRKALEEFSKL